MVNSGVCCSNLRENKALMKMGLTLVLVGHVNFLLGALVHGAVLRHIVVQTRVRTLVYAISNIIAIVAGLMGIITGIIVIVLSKNKKNRTLTWVLLVFSILAGFLGVISAVGVSFCLVKAFIHKEESILKRYCNFFDQDFGSATITKECPFDPTRIYATSIILWMPLIVMCIVEAVFTFRCFAACTSFLYLCPCRKEPLQAKRVRIQRKAEILTPLPDLEPRAGAEEEPEEQDELLHSGEMQNEWV
ncbi:transmembrane protein 54a isoform X1 [Girardinichthys multiradiatus]|uniref:transmembrane protein 54a isoform X1 n=2 Tax=Girardinichthys multiradiatus TaxID=208333 RepID=UPI001FAE08C0|nr:transmembrane protein 54a isoform X1 [Girardinichthys multiradiatus]